MPPEKDEPAPTALKAITPPHPPTRKRSSANSFTDSDFAMAAAPAKTHSRKPSFSFRNADTFPCAACGEAFASAHLLELHQSARHAVSELHDGDTAKNVVSMIFQSSWPSKLPPATVRRVLKIHNSPKMVARFEDYREAIKAKAAIRRDERCMADGNELLRFHCTTYLCSLGRAGNGLCEEELCSVCGIVKDGFSVKMDGIGVMGSSKAAHEAIPAEVEEEFEYMNVKRAMLVCRVVAGRVGREEEEGGCNAGVVVDGDREGKGDGAFDSVVVRRGDGEEEVVVFSPRAVLPCFVIIYSV